MCVSTFSGGWIPAFAGMTLARTLSEVGGQHVYITCESRALNVDGHVDQRPKEMRRPIRSECGIGDYVRGFTLGDTIDTDRITAEFVSGDLRKRRPPETPAPGSAGTGVFIVHRPKFERTRPIRIQVT